MYLLKNNIYLYASNRSFLKI